MIKLRHWQAIGGAALSCAVIMAGLYFLNQYYPTLMWIIIGLSVALGPLSLLRVKS